MPENITNTHKTQVRTIPKQVNNTEINYKKEQYSYNTGIKCYSSIVNNTGIPVLGSQNTGDPISATDMQEIF